MVVGRRRRSMLLLALCVVLAVADAYKFGATTGGVAVIREDSSEVREATTGSVVERASSLSISRPVTADEEVEKAEAELIANGNDTTVKPTEAPVPTNVVPRTTAPRKSQTAAATTPTPTQTTIQEPSGNSSSSGSLLSADDLSSETEAGAERNANSSLDKTVVIVIVGIVAAIGVTALLVSRQIKNVFDGESDEEL